MDEYEFHNGEVVRVNDTFTVTQNNHQLGIRKDAKMTVERLARSHGGVNTYFTVEFGDTEPMDNYDDDSPHIVENAMEKMLRDGLLQRLS